MFQFKSLPELTAHFSDDKTCRDYLEQKRWNGIPVCPHCGTTKVYRLANGKQFKCGNKKTCDKKFTVTVGTVFENSKISLSTWFAAIYLCTSRKKGTSSLQLMRDLGITQKTAWFMLHRIREMVKPATKIELSDTVQVDETYVKGKTKNLSKHKRKQIAEGTLKYEPTTVLGLVQNNENVVVKVVPNAEADTLKPVIYSVIKDNQTVIVTDGHPSYNNLELYYKGRIIINHANNEYANGMYNTNTIEGFFSILKRTFYGTYHFVSPKHMQRYCEEVSYRYNGRKLNESQRFDITLNMTKGRLTYNNLINKRPSVV